MKNDDTSKNWRETTIKACRTANEKLTAYKGSLVSRRDSNICILNQIKEKKEKK